MAFATKVRCSVMRARTAEVTVLEQLRNHLCHEHRRDDNYAYCYRIHVRFGRPWGHIVRPASASFRRVKPHVANASADTQAPFSEVVEVAGHGFDWAFAIEC